MSVQLAPLPPSLRSANRLLGAPEGGWLRHPRYCRSRASSISWWPPRSSPCAPRTQARSLGAGSERVPRHGFPASHARTRRVVHPLRTAKGTVPLAAGVPVAAVAVPILLLGRLLRWIRLSHGVRGSRVQPQRLRALETSTSRVPGLITQPRDPGCLAHPGVDQVEVGLPAVSLVVLPALDPVAVLADGCGEALLKGRPSRQSLHSPLPMLIW
jgi:hypothetical protein